MKTTIFVLAAVLGLVAPMAPAAVRADTIFIATGCTLCTGTIFDISLSGTETINTSSGLVTASNLTTIRSGVAFVPLQTIQVQQPSSATTFEVVLTGSIPTVTASFAMFFPTATLVGYAGGPLCTVSNPCGSTPFSFVLFTGQTSGSVTFSTLSLTPVPEPPAIILLGTGLVGLMGMGWRRKRLA